MLNKLIAKQRELGMSDREFAAVLGVARSTWQLARTNRRPIGRDLVAGIVKAFPEYGQDALSFLVSSATNDATAATLASPEAVA